VTAADDGKSGLRPDAQRRDSGAEVDDDDDPQLTSLRAVWVSMRDEEPSDRGLSALMAAAREKAVEMKPRESWWQRVLVQLRRPPVLALATLVLLVGGGVIISQREDLRATAVPETAVQAEAPGAVAPQAPAMGSGAINGDGGGAPRGGGAATVAPVEAPAENARRLEDRAPAAAAPPTESKPTAPSRKPMVKPPAPKQEKLDTQAKPSSSSTLKDKTIQREAPPAAPMTIASGELEEAAPSPTAGASAPAADEGKAAAATRAAPPSIDALIKQCDAAAARGDCATAKRLAGQIQQLDAKAYRARITTSATIKPCL